MSPGDAEAYRKTVGTSGENFNRTRSATPEQNPPLKAVTVTEGPETNNTWGREEIWLSDTL